MEQENKKIIICKDKKDHEIEVAFNAKCFGPCKIEDFKEREERRFNLKVKDSDILLLDIASKELGISRNTLITLILDIVLLKWINEVEDIDTRVLISLIADDLSPLISYTESLGTSWELKLFPGLRKAAINNCLRYGSELLEDYGLPPGERGDSDELKEAMKNLLEAKVEKNVSEITRWESRIKKIYGRSDSFDSVRKLLEKNQEKNKENLGQWHSHIAKILNSASYEATCELIENALLKHQSSKND